MYYLLVENNQVISVLDYEPEVPDSVTVVMLTAEEHKNLVEDKISYFDVPSMSIKKYSQDQLNQQASVEETEKINAENRDFLSKTDWKVLRHLREKALGIATSLSEDEYLELEHRREAAANSIL